MVERRITERTEMYVLAERDDYQLTNIPFGCAEAYLFFRILGVDAMHHVNPRRIDARPVAFSESAQNEKSCRAGPRSYISTLVTTFIKVGL